MLFIELKNIPFDRVVDGQFVHATGYGLAHDDGYVQYLYEGDPEPGEDDMVVDESDYERWFS